MAESSELGAIDLNAAEDVLGLSATPPVDPSASPALTPLTTDDPHWL
jgi:hypothetical protein